VKFKVNSEKQSKRLDLFSVIPEELPEYLSLATVPENCFRKITGAAVL
jgi:hypothetical protein